MSAVRCAAMAPAGPYAYRAARLFLDAYAAQNGTARTVACPMTYAANMLGKVVTAGPLELERVAGEWWGTYFHRAATTILAHHLTPSTVPVLG